MPLWVWGPGPIRQRLQDKKTAVHEREGHCLQGPTDPRAVRWQSWLRGRGQFLKVSLSLSPPSSGVPNSFLSLSLGGHGLASQPQRAPPGAGARRCRDPLGQAPKSGISHRRLRPSVRS